MNDNSIQLEILQSSYWEHFKYAKDISLILPIENPKRQKIEAETNKIAEQIKQLKDK